ncbi:MAG: hypothetical protein LBH16_05410 [Treponema sp.]|jgi:hypothetical protein|nr:hypothetical protein [Treponema sp.]
MEQKDFVRQAAYIVQRAYTINLKGRKQGLGEIGDDIRAEGLKRLDIFEFGIKLASEGVDSANINNILSGIISRKQDETAKRLKTMQKEAVLCIRDNTNSWMLFNSIFSLMTGNEQKEARELLKDKVFTDYFKNYWDNADSAGAQKQDLLKS